MSGERLERLLRSALVPVEPPEALSDRLERTLSGARRDGRGGAGRRGARRDARSAQLGPPRRGRSLVGSMAGGGARAGARRASGSSKRESSGLRALEKGVRDLAGDLEKRLRSLIA